MSNAAALDTETDEATKTAQFIVNSTLANEVLAVFGVPVPDAADLDEIRIIIRDSAITDNRPPATDN